MKSPRARVEELELQKAEAEMMTPDQFWMKEAQNTKRKLGEVRKGAREWKRRALEAEKRCVELLEERMQREKEHNDNLNIIAGELVGADKKLLEMQEELQQARFGREELRYELVRVKAHAYDLAFGDEQHDED